MIPILNNINWLDTICAESRSKFFPSKTAYKVLRKANNGLISTDECYSFIKKNIKPKHIIQEDELWKIPIILVCLGCILVIIMTICFVCQYLIGKVQASTRHTQFDFNICDEKRSKQNHKAVQSERQKSDDKTWCTCLRSK
ncbi:uncharacterized protein LOC108100348 [Drosophila ficusphila]|uniref:uncharacterized protein LOC108100348 n=1 Tax=Drosophila ficusphila TaxID=30025 RepID=UPI0007E7E832|nr:uncharacterized protein LOC108100348 [Drosophila ficusphila]